MSSLQEVKMYTRARSRRRMLDLDLNVAPPIEIRDQEAVSRGTRSQDRQEAGRNSTMQTPIDVEALDDDVIISSPTAFAQAKTNSRRNRPRTIIVDVDNDERPPRKCKKIPTNQPIINCELYISSSTKKNVPPPVPRKESTFNCPVCMGPLVQETSTKCGHIFCMKCIKASIAAQGKCPTCRAKTTLRDIIRVYLPASS